MIRPATAADIPRFVELGRIMHAESRFAPISFDAEKLTQTLQGVLERGCLLAAERDGEIVGGFAGIATEYYFSRERMAGDLALFVEPSKRGGFIAAGLVRAFKAWAARQGIKHVELGISTGVHVDLVGALYERLGLRRQGSLYAGEI